MRDCLSKETRKNSIVAITTYIFFFYFCATSSKASRRSEWANLDLDQVKCNRQVYTTYIHSRICLFVYFVCLFVFLCCVFVIAERAGDGLVLEISMRAAIIAAAVGE